jgi:hypothetical protein
LFDVHLNFKETAKLLVISIFLGAVVFFMLFMHVWLKEKSEDKIFSKNFWNSGNILIHPGNIYSIVLISGGIACLFLSAVYFIPPK